MTYCSRKSVYWCWLHRSRSTRKKAKKKKKLQETESGESQVFTHADHQRCRSTTWICMWGHSRDEVIYSKYHRHPSMFFGGHGGRNLATSISV